MHAAAALAGATLALIVLGARAEAHPSEAERLYKEGQGAYDERRYDAALALWQRSYELSQLPGLLFNLAQAYRLRSEGGDCARAVESYRKFVLLDPGSPRRAIAESWIRELEECAKPAPSDDQPAAQKPRPTDSETGSPRRGGAGTGAEAGAVQSRAPGGGAPERVAGLIVGSGGAAAALVGVYFGDRARRLGDEVSRACAQGCVWTSIASKDAEGRAAERRQWILYGVGAGGLLVGAALYYLGAREPTPTVAVAPRDGGGLLVWSRPW